ncbi:MAG: hypothetical protein AAGA12_11405 [Pseudomonadota bacterium]
MAFFILIIVGVVLIFTIGGSSKATTEAQATATREQLFRDRALAYSEEIERTQTPQHFAQMGRHERIEKLLTQIRAYDRTLKTGEDAGGFVLVAGLVIGVILGISVQEWGPFIFVALIGFGLGWLIDNACKKSAIKQAETLNLNPGRLFVA